MRPQDLEALWHEPPWLPGGLPPRSVGETCSAILIKLIIDLWLQHPGGQCLALVLSMLATGLAARPAVQCRVFDLLVNLHVHGELMFGQRDEAQLEEGQEGHAGAWDWL